MNCSTLSRDLLPVFMFYFRPTFCSLDMTINLVFSAFTSRPVPLVAVIKECVLFSINNKVMCTNCNPPCLLEHS